LFVKSYRLGSPVYFAAFLTDSAAGKKILLNGDAGTDSGFLLAGTV
jgi:hypothetical protein